SLPQLFRYERQQKGRLREHFQLNVDIFGEADVAADAELLAVACGIMRACGLGPEDVRARVSDRRLLTALVKALGVTDVQVPLVFAAVDKVGRDTYDALVRRMTEGGVDKDVAEEVLTLVEGTRGMKGLDFARTLTGDAAVQAIVDNFDEYFELLEAHGVREYVELDLTIVRGLAYYTGIVFELFDATGEFRAICGGGRYDTLLQSLGGVDMPALGFGMGDVVLSELLKARGKMPSGAPEIDYWVAPREDEDRLDALRVATRLRAAGARVESPLKDQALAKQLKAANAVGARDVVFVGKSFGTNDEVEIKSLADGSQEVMRVDDLALRFRDRHRSANDRP
ncbi:MAG: ATP phosphoribosyltransferase regulatory subunit, partial [Cytophagaceae bacterium]|nr:ATP phosphoribosyltransferase regulatory subunit [Gemmatimonadaceae bacterium]